METKTKDIYFAASLEEARATLQTIITVAQGYGNCLTDGIYCTDIITQESIINELCRVYVEYCNYENSTPGEGATIDERAAILKSFVTDNIAALPKPIKAYLRRLHQNSEVYRDIDNEIDDIITATTAAVNAADNDNDYTYAARLATAEMNACIGIYNPDAFDPDSIYIGLRLAAIKLQLAITNATGFASIVPMEYGRLVPTAGADFVAMFQEMTVADNRARALLFGFTGIDYRDSDLCIDDDMEITQVFSILKRASAANNNDIKKRVMDLWDIHEDMSLSWPTTAAHAPYQALMIVHALRNMLHNIASKQPTIQLDDIRSSDVTGNALKE